MKHRTKNRRARLTHFATLALASALACQPTQPPAPELDEAWSESQRILDDVRLRLQESSFYDSPTSQAEAFRYLSGLIALHNHSHLHFSDPPHPMLYRVGGIGNKWGFSNPDNLYLSANVTGKAAYRITGRLGTANQTTIGSYAGDTEDARAGERVRGEDLILAEDGTFELILSADRQPGNWLPLDPEATSISIYQIFGDWDREKKGAFRLETIGAEGQPSPPLEPSVIAERLVRAAENVRHTIESWLDIADTLSWIPANSLAPPRRIQVASLGAWFVAGQYKLNAGEALLVEVPVPNEARYWGWTLYNPWSETLDFANRQTSLNFMQTRADADGVMRLVLAAEDPGVPNWLDISGHPSGFLAWRVTSEIEPAQPEAQTVSLAELRAALPAETPSVTPDERRKVIHRRQEHVAWRYAD